MCESSGEERRGQRRGGRSSRELGLGKRKELGFWGIFLHTSEGTDRARVLAETARRTHARMGPGLDALTHTGPALLQFFFFFIFPYSKRILSVDYYIHIIKKIT